MRYWLELMRKWSGYVFGSRAKEITPHIRMLRLNEEAIELGQAENVTQGELLIIINQVYAKPPGALYQELGGVMTCLIAYCDIRGFDPEDAFFAEFTRIMDPAVMEKVRKRNLEGDKIGFQKQKPTTCDCMPGEDHDRDCPRRS
jgi:NTP pyrophosphatase (non-canonical NTP hydrolase)